MNLNQSQGTTSQDTALRTKHPALMRVFKEKQKFWVMNSGDCFWNMHDPEHEYTATMRKSRGKSLQLLKLGGPL